MFTIAPQKRGRKIGPFIPHTINHLCRDVEFADKISRIVECTFEDLVFEVRIRQAGSSLPPRVNLGRVLAPLVFLLKGGMGKFQKETPVQVFVLISGSYVPLHPLDAVTIVKEQSAPLVVPITYFSWNKPDRVLTA